MNKPLLFTLCLALLFSLALAHEDSQDPFHPHSPVDYLPIDPFPLALGAFFVILLLSFLSLVFQSRMNEIHKKTVFVFVGLLVIFVTLYAGATTVYLNLISESGGPVHWHADFEVWVCGGKITNLVETIGLESYVGTPVLHHHNDYRMHVEGLVVKKSDVSLQNFFSAIGGTLEHDSIEIPLRDKSLLKKQNGDLCNGKPGKLQLFVKNGQTSNEFVLAPELQEYVLSPYYETVATGVGEGDLLKIVFDAEGENNGG